MASAYEARLKYEADLANDQFLKSLGEGWYRLSKPVLTRQGLPREYARDIGFDASGGLTREVVDPLGNKRTQYIPASKMDNGAFFDSGIGGVVGALALAAVTGGIGLAGAGALGLSGAAAGATAGAIGGGLSAAVTGNNIGKGVLLGGITGGVGASLAPVASSVSSAAGGGTVGTALGNAAKGAITGGVSSALQGGDIVTGALGGGINGGVNSLITSGINSFRDPVVADSSSTNAVNDKFGPVDYSLSSGANGPGLKLTNGGAGFTQGLLDDGFGVGLLDQPVMSQPGLKAPDLPNLLGVGTPGLSVSVPGGKVSAVGFVPKNASPTLGNPSSIVNNPNALGTPVLGDGKLLTQSTPAPSVPAPKTNINVAGLLGLGAGGAALGGLLSDGGGSDIKSQRYGLTGRTFNYDGDLDTYGQTATGDFRFYRPTMGLLG